MWCVQQRIISYRVYTQFNAGNCNMLTIDEYNITGCIYATTQCGISYVTSCLLNASEQAYHSLTVSATLHYTHLTHSHIHQFFPR